MTFHQRSRINSPIDYTDYFTVNGIIGCCCGLTLINDILQVAVSEDTFSYCNSIDGYYFIPPEGMTCGEVGCALPGSTGCCCSCTYLTPEQRALLDENIIGATFGMLDNVQECDCQNIGGKWTQGPCNRDQPFAYCRKPNGVDVRLPKACCGVTLGEVESEEEGGPPLIGAFPICKDVCNARECSLNTIINYSAYFYNNGRRCFFSNNAGGPVAASCTATPTSGSGGLIPTPPAIDYTLPVCNNSNFICWGNNCQPYVNLIDNGFYGIPTVGDYNTLVSSGGASRLQNFKPIDDGKGTIGNGLFSQFNSSYIHIKSRFNRAALVTQDNKVIFAGAPLQGVVNGVPIAPLKYDVAPFYKYDRVELGKNFAILRKQSNIGPRADFIGSFVSGNGLTAGELNFSGVQSVHAMEEAICITRLNFLTNNIELWCKGYPFNTNNLQRYAGDDNDTVDPESVSCNGFHCTYKLYTLNEDRVVQNVEWETIGEYKRTRDSNGQAIIPPYGRLNYPYDRDGFPDGIVIAGYNFDCFMEKIVQDPANNSGVSKLSCYGMWDPSDTNKKISEIRNHEFGVLGVIPEKGGLYADCDYHKCFAVMPTVDYCESNSSGICCIIGSECDCTQNVTQSECEALNGNFYEPGTYTCSECEEECESQGGGGGEDEPPACCDEFPYDNANCDCSYAGTCENFTNANGIVIKKGACCVTQTCQQTGTIRYSVKCRTQQHCSSLGGIFHENKKPVEVSCGPLDTPGKCCYNSRTTDGLSAPGECFNCQRETGTCIEGWTNRKCMRCAHINENNECIYEDDNGQPQPFNTGSYWSETGDCCNC